MASSMPKNNLLVLDTMHSVAADRKIHPHLKETGFRTDITELSASNRCTQFLWRN